MTEFAPTTTTIPEPDSPTAAWVLLHSNLEKPIDFTPIFGNDRPVEIEVGIGSGFFLSRYATDHPEINLLGIDKESSEVMRSADKARRLGLMNIRTLRYEARILLEEYIKPGSIANLHVYYSDPWPKKKHHRRRLWQPEFVKAAWGALAPGGCLYMKTDVTEYFEMIDRNIRESGLFDCEFNHRLDEESLDKDYETNFQAKAREKGHPLYYQIWKKKIP